MARYPKGVWRPLPENATQPRISPQSFFVHSAAVDSANLHGYFTRQDVKLESHFFVRKDGVVEQFMDSEVRADANGEANGFALSAETEDDGKPDVQPWTAQQLSALIDLIGWACDTHNIPRRLLARWDGHGVGWHSQFGAPSPLTSVRGKTCPGRVRIQQFKDIVLPAVVENVQVGFRPPLAAPTVTDYPEALVKRIDVQIDTDSEGRGYRDITASPREVVSVISNTANPPDSGYKPIPDCARLDVGGRTRIVVEEAVPNGRIDVTVWVA